METHSFSTLERVEAKEAADPGGGAGDDCHFQYPRTGRSQGSLPVERLVHDQDGLSVPSNGSKPRKPDATVSGASHVVELSVPSNGSKPRKRARRCAGGCDRSGFQYPRTG